MSEQLEFHYWLQQIRSPLLDTLIGALNFFDTMLFFTLLLSLIWLGLGWKVGMRLFFIFSLSRLTNMSAKVAFALPRPFHLDPTLGIIQVEGYGFPSGAAQSAILFSGLLILYWKNRWKWAVAITYTLLISFSRLYLGVHFPIDVLGGWAIGLALIGVYCKLFPKIESLLAKSSPHTVLIVYQSLFILPILFSPSSLVITHCATAMGLGGGVYLFTQQKWKLPPAKSLLQWIIRGVILALGLFFISKTAALFLAPKCLFIQFFQFLLVGLWVSLFAPLLCIRQQK